MLRVRLKADGRLVEILPDGSERAIPSDPRSIATAAHQAARSVDARSLDATYARSVRGRTGLTQAAFAARIGVPVETVRNWEQGKRSPRGPARALLKVIEQAPGRGLCGARQGEFPLAAERPFVVRIGLAIMPAIADPWSARREACAKLQSESDGRDRKSCH